ncbi:MAG: phenylalanine--tRNA ligase subunit beta [Patescibacteria group bacterium]
MKVIQSWLADYILRFNISPEKLSALLTARAVEVDEVLDLKDKLQSIVVGKILTMEKHPNAARLRVAKVSLGAKRLSIVCGAPNIYAGMYVAVAQPGAHVVDMQSGEWKQLEAATIRGVASEGMIVGADELALATGAAAQNERLVMDLTEVAKDTHVGKSIVSVLDVSPVYDLDVLANRPDLMSHRGVAKEIAGLLKLKYTEPTLSLPKARSKKAPITIQIQAKRLVPRYAGLVLSGVKFQPSPLWMQHRLRRAGIRPINLVVDVTNYVMLDVGQPLHAFDLDKVVKFMRVRESKKGEKLMTLDGKQHELPPGAIVIEDGSGLIDLAGIMGGQSSMITDQTQRIFIQAAVFSPERVRMTSRALGHRTEASGRYEKGVSPVLVDQALQLAYDLLHRLMPSVQLESMVDIKQPVSAPVQVVIRTAKTNSLLGSRVTPQQIETVIKTLGFTVLKKTQDSLKVRPPLHRLDVKIEEDVIEEVGRYMDYNSLPKTGPVLQLEPAPTTDAIRLRPMIFSTLATAGWTEVMQLSFTNAQHIKLTGKTEKEYMRLVNPMSEDQAFMRSELLSTLVTLAKKHLRLGTTPKIFELAKVFIAQGTDWAEIPHLAGMTVGKDSFAQVKGGAEALLKRLHIDQVRFEPATHWAFYPDTCLSLKLGKESIGTIGQINPELAKQLGVDQPCAGFELSYDQLIHLTSPRFAYQDIPVFPNIILDISVIIPENIQWKAVEEVVRNFGGEFLSEVKPFDIYTGDPIPKGKKNLAFRVEFQAKDRTLEMSEAENARTQIVAQLNQKWGANLR